MSTSSLLRSPRNNSLYFLRLCRMWPWGQWGQWARRMGEWRREQTVVGLLTHLRCDYSLENHLIFHPRLSKKSRKSMLHMSPCHSTFFFVNSYPSTYASRSHSVGILWNSDQDQLHNFQVTVANKNVGRESLEKLRISRWWQQSGTLNIVCVWNLGCWTTGLMPTKPVLPECSSSWIWGYVSLPVLD